MSTRLRRRLRWAFGDAGATFDLCRASLMLALGIWLLQPGWLAHRFPRIAADMVEAAPIWVWGLCCTLVALMLIISVVSRRETWLLCSYLITFGFWVMLGWIFCVRAAPPPPLGVLAPVLAFYTMVRLIQVGDDRRGQGGR